MIWRKGEILLKEKKPKMSWSLGFDYLSLCSDDDDDDAFPFFLKVFYVIRKNRYIYRGSIKYKLYGN